MKKLILPLFFALLFGQNIFAQDLGTTLKNVGPEYAKSYLAPFTTGLGTNLNSGWFGGFDPAGYSKLPFVPHFYVGVKFNAVILQDQDRIFTQNFRTTIPINGTNRDVILKMADAPTIIGYTSAPMGQVYDANTNAYLGQYATIGGINNSQFMPLVVPHFGFGTLLGTDIMLRFSPGFDMGDYGSFTMFGAALRHSLGGYVKKMPFDISAQFGYQTLGLKDKYHNKFITGNSMFVNLQFSKNIAIVTIYGGAQYENYSVDVNYKFNVNGYEQGVSFTQTGDNSFRGIAGATVHLGPLHINLDANLGNKFSFSSGIGIGL
jgi:hypothetical protein